MHSVMTAVRYLGLIGDPWHHAAVAQFATGFGGMLLFQTSTSAAQALAVCGATRLFRLSVGLEHPDDLIVDLAEALRS